MLGKRVFAIILGVLALFLLIGGAIYRHFPIKVKEEKMIKAVYGFSKDLEIFRGKNGKEIARIVKDWGINAVFGGYEDPELLEALHRVGIKVYGTVGIFGGEEYWRRYPESRPINDKGKPIEKDRWYAGVIPTIEAIRREKLEEIEKLATKDIDGIWLDAIRWPGHWEVPSPRIEETSFDPITLEKFQEDTKISIPEELLIAREKASWILKNHEREWRDWRCKEIADFVKEAREITKGKTLGIFTVPWQEKDFNNAIKNIIGQDYFSLGEYVDFLSPMVYHQMCEKRTDWIGEIIEYVHRESGKPILPIIQAGNIPQEEFKEAIKIAIEAEGSKGVIIFTIQNVLKEEKLSAMKNTFSSLP